MPKLVRVNDCPMDIDGDGDGNNAAMGSNNETSGEELSVEECRAKMELCRKRKASVTRSKKSKRETKKKRNYRNKKRAAKETNKAKSDEPSSDIPTDHSLRADLTGGDVNGNDSSTTSCYDDTVIDDMMCMDIKYSDVQLNLAVDDWWGRRRRESKADENDASGNSRADEGHSDENDASGNIRMGAGSMYVHKFVDTDIIVNCQCPKKPKAVKSFIIEILRRGLLCQKRNQYERAFILYEKGIDYVKDLLKRDKSPVNFGMCAKLYDAKVYTLMESRNRVVGEEEKVEWQEKLESAARQSIRYNSMKYDSLSSAGKVTGDSISNLWFNIGRFFDEATLLRLLVEAKEIIGDEENASTIVDEPPMVDYSSMTVEQLKGELRSKKLKVSGRKAELIARLQEWKEDDVTVEEDEDEDEDDSYYENSRRIMKNAEYQWSKLLDGHVSEDLCCSNCRRRRFTTDTKDPFYFDWYLIWSNNIKELRSPLKVATSSRKRKCSKQLLLCTECHGFLTLPAQVNAQWKYTWPSFYWNLLTGRDSVTDRAFHQTYSAQELWKFIPASIREYWCRSDGDDGRKCHLPLYQDCPDYDLCTLEAPQSVFVDRTRDVYDHWDNVHSRTYKGMLLALDPSRVEGCEKKKPSTIPDVLCPWGCSEFCYKAKEINPSLLIQNQLRKVQLNLPSNMFGEMYTVETSRVDYIRNENECKDRTLLNPEWLTLPSMLMLHDGGYVACACRDHDNCSSRKRLYLHPPRKPDGMNLSAVNPDELCQATRQPSIVTPVCRKKNGSTPTNTLHQCSFMGSSSGYVTNGTRFQNKGPKVMNFIHQVHSRERKDIKQISKAFVNEGKVPQAMIDEIEHHHISACQKYIEQTPKRGATYSPTVNSILMQKFSSEEGCRTCVTFLDGDGNEVQCDMDRTWSATIYNLQVEDPRNYGWPMKSMSSTVPVPIEQRRQSAMLTYALVGMTSTCKELYHAIDQRRNGHRYNDYSGHLLTFIHHKYMKHEDKMRVNKSPFKNGISRKGLCEFVELSLPDSLVSFEASYDDKEKDDFYMFGLEYFQQLFPSSNYPGILVVGGSKVDDVTADQMLNKDIIIHVSGDMPQGKAHFNMENEETDESVKFEARVVLGVAPDGPDNNWGSKAKKRSKMKKMIRKKVEYSQMKTQEEKDAEKEAATSEFESQDVFDDEEIDEEVTITPQSAVSEEESDSKKDDFEEVSFVSFDSFIMARHGSGYSEWWQQRFKQKLMTQYERQDEIGTVEDSFPAMGDFQGFKYVTVYVRGKSHDVEQYKVDMLTSVGGQDSVLCNCRSGLNPLIVSKFDLHSKRPCMLDNCNKREKYTCTNDDCNTRVCNSCFDKIACSGNTVTIDSKGSEFTIDGIANRSNVSGSTDASSDEDEIFPRNVEDDNEYVHEGGYDDECDSHNDMDEFMNTGDDDSEVSLSHNAEISGNPNEINFDSVYTNEESQSIDNEKDDCNVNFNEDDEEYLDDTSQTSEGDSLDASCQGDVTKDLEWLHHEEKHIIETTRNLKPPGCDSDFSDDESFCGNRQQTAFDSQYVSRYPNGIQNYSDNDAECDFQTQDEALRNNYQAVLDVINNGSHSVHHGPESLVVRLVLSCFLFSFDLFFM